MRTVFWLPAVLVGCIEYDSLSGVDAGLGATETTEPPLATEELPPGWAGESWDLPAESDTIDVIFYGDTSNSMTEELVTLGENVASYLDRMAQFVPDWQLATVTGNTGCAVNGILTPQTPGYTDAFADAIVTPPVDTDEDEMGLQNVAIAVEASRPGGCNEGLVRGGLLSIVFISDENDESPGYDADPDYWRGYYDRIAAVHGDPLSIVISAVAGPTPDGCEGADPGFGYDEAVAGTAGELLSICDDWAGQLDLLADAAVIRDTFVLSEPAVPETIQVWINAVELPDTSWTWFAPRNAIVLDQPAQPGDRVDIVYEVAAE
jgi:hypothetical protein